MANTFKFGNGEWAVGKETALAYNDENNNFKPLPFTFDRASTATVVNKDGLIETVGTDEPRIDFLNNTKGHLLLEPQRSNYLLQSNQFDTTWVLSSSIDLTSGQTGVGGSDNAWLLKRNSTGSRYIQQSLSLSSAQYSYSVYLKAESTNWAYVWSYDGVASVNVYIDLENGVIGNTSGSNLNDVSIESVGNGWYRVTLIYTQGTTLVRIYPAYANGSVSTGTDNGIYIQYAQLEQGSYATSYIPTSGQSGGVTRVSELPFGREDMVDLDLYSTEMTWFYDINLFYKEGGTTVAPRLISTSNSQVFIGLSIPNVGGTDLRIRHKDGTTAANTSAVSFTNGGRFKIAVKITGTTGTAYINGTNLGTFTTLAASNYDEYENVQNNPNNINDMRFYDTALSDSELQALTS